MNTVGTIALFYVCGAVVVGLTVGVGYESVTLTRDGRQLPFARLLAAVMFGVLWPITVLKIIFGKL